MMYCKNLVMMILLTVAICTVWGEQLEQKTVVGEVYRTIATQITVGTLEKGAEVYPGRKVTVETIPEELVGWTLIALSHELRWARVEGLHFTIDRPAVVYVGYDERIKVPPDWLKTQFEKTAFRMRIHQAEVKYVGGRPELEWSVDMWKKSFPTGVVAFGPNKDEFYPYLVVVEKGAKVINVHFSGPMADPIAGLVKEGVRAYPDRTYVLKGVLPELEGAVLLAMKQGFAYENGKYGGPYSRIRWIDTAGRELRLARDATVYIAYDATSVTVPQWIMQGGFSKTTLSIKVGDIKLYNDRSMTIYAKHFKAGENVWLGPNRGEGWSGWPLQYLVMVSPSGNR